MLKPGIQATPTALTTGYPPEGKPLARPRGSCAVFWRPQLYWRDQAGMRHRKQGPGWARPMRGVAQRVRRLWQDPPKSTTRREVAQIWVLADILVMGVGNPQNLPRGSSRATKGLYLKCHKAQKRTVTVLQFSAEWLRAPGELPTARLSRFG